MPESAVTRIPRIEHRKVLKAFRALGYSEDLNTPDITVLRQNAFPFRRITIPNNPAISTELIRLYLLDLKIDFEVFYNLLEAEKP